MLKILLMYNKFGGSNEETIWRRTKQGIERIGVRVLEPLKSVESMESAEIRITVGVRTFSKGGAVKRLFRNMSFGTGICESN
uniref:Uncharacterized protein n=1 Tax=Leptospira santarosai serovar Arenal str. MAVJ 401 TaxID=1049976 RepID=M6JCU1_9LEPT|nr:hypothetical protein LEP1GSC063_2725 [Leptospira santarosai serovar Arenal str. MAVJ 401]